MKLQSIKRYDAYKDSGVEWIGKIPVHWINGRVKDFIDTNPITKIPSDIAEDDLVEFIPMTNVNDELGQIKKFNFVNLKEVSTGYTKFKNGDVIFAKITPCMENGNCAIVSGLTHNICFGSTEFMVFRAFRKLTAKYLHYFLHNDTFRRNAEPFMRGTAGQKRITSHHMATHCFVLPPAKEQQAIAAYLDTKTTQIDRQIDLLSQKVVQYGKLKQSLINETVTCGLDKTVAMKDSGVEWIGKVPAHWDIKHLKNLAEIKGGKDSKEVELGEGGYPVYGSGGVFGRASKYLHKKPSVLLGRKGTVDKPLFVTEPFWSVDTMFYTDIKNDVDPKFFYYQCLTIKFGLYQYGSAVPSMAQNVLRQILFATPDYLEQQAIANYLDEKTAHIDRIVATINSQIDKLKELRRTLINDAVTGKIKVA